MQKRRRGRRRRVRLPGRLASSLPSRAGFPLPDGPARPRLRMTRAEFTSRSCVTPHPLHTQCRSTGPSVRCALRKRAGSPATRAGALDAFATQRAWFSRTALLQEPSVPRIHWPDITFAPISPALAECHTAASALSWKHLPPL